MMINETEVSNPSGLDSCVRAIQSLSINTGDVLVIRFRGYLSPQVQRNLSDSFRTLLGECHKDNLIIVLGDGIDLSLLNEEAMRKHSWMRATTESAKPLDDKDIEILDLRRQLKEANDLYAEREKEATMRRCISQVLGQDTIESVEFKPDMVEGQPEQGYKTFSFGPCSTLTVRLRAPANSGEEVPK